MAWKRREEGCEVGKEGGGGGMGTMNHHSWLATASISFSQEFSPPIDTHCLYRI